MTILVTGGTGFLGVHLVRELLRTHPGTTVTVVSRARPKEVRARIGTFLTAAGDEDLGTRITAVRGDLTEPRLGLARTDLDALTDTCDAVWHCAADTRLDLDQQTLRRTNVTATGAVLDLVAAGRRMPRLFYVGTAFVAGGRRFGTVLPDDLDDSFGFENYYERSKFEAERLVRDWATDQRRPTTIFRPSLLVTDRTASPGMPSNSYVSFLRGMASSRYALLARHVRVPANLRIRVQGDRRGRVNLLPVDLAATRMVRLAQSEPAGLVQAHHVVHDHDVAVPMLIEVGNDILRTVFDATVVLVEQPVPSPTQWERLVARVAPSILRYLNHLRHYDDSSVRMLLGQEQHRIRVDRDYLTTAATSLLSQMVPDDAEASNHGAVL